MEQEFIIGITEHRLFGNVFTPFLIGKNKSFYTVIKHVKKYDLDVSDYTFAEHEKELIKIIEGYSDETLVKKFARKENKTNFWQNLDKDLFQNHISPYIDKQISKCVSILMGQSTRIFLKQAKYANLYDEDEIKVNRTFADCIFCFDRTSDGTRYSLALEQDGNRFALQHKNIRIIAHEPCCLVYRNHLYAFEHLSSKKINPFLDKEFIFVPKPVEDKYYKSFVLNSIRENKVQANGFTIEEKLTEKAAILSLEPTLQYKPAFFVRFKNGNKEFDPVIKSEVFVNLSEHDGTYRFEKIRRDQAWEKTVFDTLSNLGLVEKRGSYTLPITEFLDDKDALYEHINWLNDNREQLEGQGFLLQQNKLGKIYSTEKQEISIELKTGSDWFDVYTKVQIGPFNIPFIQLRKHILNGIREFELPNGEVAILPKEWFARYQEILPFTKASGDYFRLKKYHFQLLRTMLKGIDKTYYQRLEEIGEPQQRATLPENLKATLRPYQEEGFSWLFHLHQHGFGGCLADDMGLGKTLQTLALLLKFKKLKREIVTPKNHPAVMQLSMFSEESEEKQQPASLLVMPTSLVHNWEREIRKFTPSLKIYRHVGTNRNNGANFKSIVDHYDVILTTYGTVRNDIELLSGYTYFYLILDESQYIKNSASKTYKAINRLESEQRLVLTGTPIENSLSDLWSQMNFLNPGLLGNLAYFKREFQTPIEKKNDEEKQEKLRILIRTFVLRRTKDEVASDLPSLTEQVRYCTMSRGQREFYEKEKSYIRNTILKNIESQGLEKSALVVLQGLTRLRQLANHPLLVEKESELESGKFDEMFRCLENLMAENHKVLIFSSFVKHLELVKRRIESKNWRYSMLTGQTIKRAEEIAAFQDNPDNQIFLISLKAGGVGLNLTSADYVFIIDPWWNPAAENQAISRAHRIGQDKKVMVYRFITEHSIEEKIQRLKDRKSALALRFVHSNNPFAKVTQEEILSLFS